MFLGKFDWRDGETMRAGGKKGSPHHNFPIQGASAGAVSLRSCQLGQREPQQGQGRGEDAVYHWLKCCKLRGRFHRACAQAEVINTACGEGIFKGCPPRVWQRIRMVGPRVSNQRWIEEHLGSEVEETPQEWLAPVQIRTHGQSQHLSKQGPTKNK